MKEIFLNYWTNYIESLIMEAHLISSTWTPVTFFIIIQKISHATVCGYNQWLVVITIEQKPSPQSVGGKDMVYWKERIPTIIKLLA